MDMVLDLKGLIKDKLKRINGNVQLFAATRIRNGHFNYIFITIAKVMIKLHQLKQKQYYHQQTITTRSSTPTIAEKLTTKLIKDSTVTPTQDHTAIPNE